MVKTHQYSKFTLKSLDEIRNSSEIILQIDKTDTYFSDSKKTCYLCEVVSSALYNAKPTVDRLTDENIKLNNENRRLQAKISKLEGRLLKTN